MPAPTVVDTHQHFWKLDRGEYAWLTPDLEPLYRDFQPADLKPLLDAAGISATIAVQAAETEAETEYLLSLTETHHWIAGVVGWVDLEAGSAPASIARLAGHSRLVGLRPMIQDIADDRWMLRDSLRPAIDAMIAQDLTFDALVMPRHLPHLLRFIDRYPDLRIVVDHGAKPEIRDGRFDDWAAQMSRIAASGRIFCKLSGLVTEAAPGWQPDDIRPYIRHILSAFGPGRVLFGSDWPVLTLAGDYAGWHRLASEELAAQQVSLADLPVRAAYPRLSL